MPTLTQKEIEERVVKVITKERKLTRSFDQKSNLRDDLLVDDMGIVEISMALEDEFNIEVTGDDNVEFTTVADFVTCVKKKLGVE